MAFTCAFCGSTKNPRGREHVFPDWLNTIGLDLAPVQYRVGRLNRVPRRWTGTPFSATVRAVCDECNHGWMSSLEGSAKPILTPLIRGEAQELPPDVQQLVAAWCFKTALVAMLSSPDDERARGYGVPGSEYANFYARRTSPEPLPHSQFWIGDYVGDRPPGSIRIVPLAIEVDGLPDPDTPAGYLLTVMVGRLLVQGVRFTTPSLYVDLATEPAMPSIWPPQESEAWPPAGARIDDPTFERMNEGRSLRATPHAIRLVPFKPAVSLKPSTLDGSKLEQPVPCGLHSIYFPAVLALEASRHGKRFAFVSGCDCPVAYLVHLEADGAHFRNGGTPEEMTDALERLEGEDYWLQDENGDFPYRELA